MDNNTDALLWAMRDVAEVQGGIGQLVRYVGITREHSYSVLWSKQKPRLGNLLSILSGLGFHVHLDQKENLKEQLEVERA